MQDKTCKFLAVVFALSLTLVHNPSVSQASSNDLAASNAALLRQMNRMEQRIDQDWQTQRRFFSNWMHQSLTAPDPFANMWRDQQQNLENLQAAFGKNALSGNGTGSSLRLTSSTGDAGGVEVTSRSWGTGTPAQAKVAYALSGQNLTGDVTADQGSTLTLSLQNGTHFKGAFNAGQKAQAAALSLDQDSVWDVTEDSYVTALTDTDTSLANIHSNGHTVYYDAANEANAWLQGQTKQLPGGGKLTPQAKPTEK